MFPRLKLSIYFRIWWNINADSFSIAANTLLSIVRLLFRCIWPSSGKGGKLIVMWGEEISHFRFDIASNNVILYFLQNLLRALLCLEFTWGNTGRTEISICILINSKSSQLLLLSLSLCCIAISQLFQWPPKRKVSETGPNWFSAQPYSTGLCKITWQ